METTKDNSLEDCIDNPSIPTKVGLSLIFVYRKITYSLYDFLQKARINPKICKFEPSCSHYSEEAIRKYGLWKGGLKGVGRILRCNPFSKGGYDPVI